ncbi:PREDICTED: gamma-glutamyltranspeptidase 1-like isoform X2 [Nicrophorus vespilloides]|uniref:Gamma-glutamyltranspeptidase 1-like isoform X2 n=1 Tax=Nicrophorus vespilloides TaxID=110193 RepID=A0ABM1MPZ6_NICVS|nr:PREDICTED: gamma-glutamyltranspeptidase 1-like isoform X2 [Nicrophorus vespilloides]
MLCSKRQVTVILVIVVIGVTVLGLCLGLLLNKDDAASAAVSVDTFIPEEVTLETGKHRGGIVTNGYECAGIGRDIILKGGSAADAAVAAMLCEGVAMPQSTGLGGGFLITIYSKSTGTVETLNAREMAPLAATENMYENDPSLSSEGGLAVAVPGELRGYEEVHKKYGKLPWKDIIQPTIDLCRNGHLVTPYLEGVFKNHRKRLVNIESLREVFVDPSTGEPWTRGHLLKRTKLAETLEIVAEEGADALYDGSLTEKFVEDVKGFGGIITVEDMNNYRPQWLDPVTEDLPDGMTLHTFPLPGSGIIMSFIMGLLKNNLNLDDIDDVTNWQRIVESFKFGYGKRTQMGDPSYVEGIENLIANMTSPEYINDIKNLMMFDNQTFQDPEYYGANFSMVEDHGTAHISVLAPNGDAVSVTGTINLIFGAKRRSQSTGIILNDEMDDFSSNYTNAFDVPPSPANFIKPGKRPLSSMTPSIITNKDGSVRLVIGAAGGTKITTSTALVAIKHIWFGQSLSEALNSKRLHHQLFPMEITLESGFDQVMMDGLKGIGHSVKVADTSDGFAAVTGVANISGIIEAVSDSRRPGSHVYIP